MVAAQDVFDALIKLQLFNILFFNDYIDVGAYFIQGSS
jgi:hypothetical protein